MASKGVVVFTETAQNGFRFGSTSVPGLEHVANRPIAHHVLDALLAAGVDEFVVLGAADVLIDVRESLTRYESGTVKVRYTISGAGPTMLSALHAAAPLVGAAPCVVHVADGLLDEPLSPYLDALQEHALDLILLCEGNPGSVPDQNLRPIMANRKRESLYARRMGLEANRTMMIPSSDLTTGAPIALFGPGVFRRAYAVDLQADGRATGEVGLDLADGAQIQVCVAEGWRRYRGKPMDLLEVNRLALDRLAPGRRGDARRDNRIEGRVQIDETASVTTSVIVGPVVVGPGARVANAYLGPYTSIGAGARVEGVEIERSIISPEARVTHIGARLVSSFVGQRSHVYRDFSLPRAMRLRVGEGDEVALC